MPPKRKRDASPSVKGLAAGESLKRTAHAIAASSWQWVATEVTDASAITAEHLSATCGLSKRNNHPFCRNKFAKLPARKESKKPRTPLNGEIEEDIIVISSDEDEDLNCTKKLCKNNPNCLNYLGQQKWENECQCFFFAIVAYLTVLQMMRGNCSRRWRTSETTLQKMRATKICR